MKQEDKQLLLKDLCARLPYGVKCIVDGLDDCTLMPSDIEEEREINPYLRPMSSMTEEEKHELYNIRPYFINSDNIVSGTQCNTFIQASECQDWLNAHYFDHHGLIEKGLAIEASEGMYNIKEK